MTHASTLPITGLPGHAHTSSAVSDAVDPDLVNLEKEDLPCRFAPLGIGSMDLKDYESYAEAALKCLPSCLNLYKVACADLQLINKYCDTLQDIARRVLTTGLHKLREQELNRCQSYAKRISHLIKALESTLAKKILAAHDKRDVEEGNALKELKKNFEDIKGKKDLSMPEPRLWQLNYPVVRHFMKDVKYYETKLNPNEEEQCKEMELLFKKDASLNLDFMLLHHMTLGTLVARKLCSVQEQELSKATERVAKARESCIGWGVKDAGTRKIPLNFGNVVIPYGNYEVVFKDGKVLDAKKRLDAAMDCICHRLESAPLKTQEVLASLSHGGLESDQLLCRMVPFCKSGSAAEDRKLCQSIIRGENDFITLCALAHHNMTLYDAYIQKLQTEAAKLKGGEVKKALKSFSSAASARSAECSDFIKTAQQTLTDEYHKALDARNDKERVRLSKLQKQLDAIKAEVTEGGAGGRVEPRLLQMNCPLLLQKGIGINFRYHMPKPARVKDGSQISYGAEMDAYFIRDASLHLDFTLLHQKVADNLPKTLRKGTASEIKKTARDNLKKAREACLSWGVPDAWSRETPHNFRDVVVLFGDYEVIFRGGQVSSVKQISGSLDQPAPQATVSEARAQVVPEATGSLLQVPPQASKQSAISHTKESGSGSAWLQLILNLSDEQASGLTTAEDGHAGKRKSPEGGAHPPEQEGSAAKRVTMESELLGLHGQR